MWQAVVRLLSEHFNYTYSITEKLPLPGGEAHKAWFVSNGKNPVFIKSDDKELLNLFRAEADQLELLSKSHTVRVPKIYGVGVAKNESFLLLEYLPLKPLDAHHAYCLGQQLAKLHQWSEQPQFGLDFDNELSTTPQPNAWHRKWSTFFAEQRIGWQLQIAAEKGVNLGNIDQIVEKIQKKLSHHQPQPSLLHGDLWPKNCGVADGEAVIFDPASYWGDRECDLAMLSFYPTLPPQIYDGYQSIWPLPTNFVDRQPLYQLYYMLNQFNLFGGEHLQAVQNRLEILLSEV